MIELLDSGSAGPHPRKYSDTFMVYLKNVILQ